MSVLNIGSYVEAIRPYLMKNSAKNDAALFLLNSVKRYLIPFVGNTK